MPAESEIVKQVAIALSQNGFVSFRNNVGFAWTGSKIERRGDNTIVIHHPRPITFGLITGASDRIGWKSVLITPEMVGKKIAVFSAIECKTKRGRISADQDNFIKQVDDAGGIAFVARSALDIANGVRIWITRIMKS